MKLFMTGAVLLLTASGWATAQSTQPSTESAALPSAPLAPTTQPAPTTDATSSKTASADSMLRRMLKSPPSAAKPLQPIVDAQSPDKTSGAGAQAPGAPVVGTLREGTFLVDRVGRLSRTSDGSQAEFRFESDGKTLHDPPVLILPNLKLMAMEQAVAGSNRDLLFRISGTLTEYRGRNYVLLEMVVVVPDVSRQF